MKNKKITKKILNDKLYSIFMTFLVLIIALSFYALKSSKTFAMGELPLNSSNYYNSYFNSNSSYINLNLTSGYTDRFYLTDNPSLTVSSSVNYTFIIGLKYIGAGSEPLLYSTLGLSNITMYFLTDTSISVKFVELVEMEANITNNNLSGNHYYGYASNVYFITAPMPSIPTNLNYFRTLAQYSNTNLNMSNYEYTIFATQMTYNNVIYDIANYDIGSNVLDYADGYADGYAEGETDGINLGYTAGYNDAITIGYDDGYLVGYDDGYINGYDDGYLNGEDDGYILGQLEDENFTFNWVSTLFSGIGVILSVEFFPNFPLSYFLAIPLTIGLFSWLMGMITGSRGDK